MLWRRVASIARGVAVIAIALQSLAGLCGDNCGGKGVMVAHAAVTSGTMHFRKGGDDGDLPIVKGVPESDTCALWASIGSSSPNGDGGLDIISYDPEWPIIEGYFNFDVRDDFTDEGFSFYVSTSDPRSWPLGEVPADDVAAVVHLTSYEACDDAGCTFCELDVPDASVRFVVEEAVGAVDDSQNRVTDDFQRKITLEVDLGGALVPLSRDTGEACENDVEASGSATFSWTSADFVWTDC